MKITKKAKVRLTALSVLYAVAWFGDAALILALWGNDQWSQIPGIFSWFMLSPVIIICGAAAVGAIGFVAIALSTGQWPEDWWKDRKKAKVNKHNAGLVKKKLPLS